MSDIEVKRVISIETGEATGNVKTLKQQIKQLRDAMGTVEQGTQEWNDLSVQLAGALQKQTEVAEAAKFSNIDIGQSLSNIASVSAGVVGSINAVNGVMNIMGVEGKAAEEAMLRLQSAMAIVQGLSAIDTGIKAWQGLKLAIDAALASRLASAGATAADTAATASNTAATAANTKATTANAAAKGSLASITSKLVSVVKASKAAFGVAAIAVTALTAIIAKLIKRSREQRQEVEGMVTANLELRDSTNEVTAKFEILRRGYTALAGDLSAKKRYLEEHKKELDAIGVSVESINNADDIFIQNSDRFIKALTDRTLAEFRLNKLESDYIANLQEYNKIQQGLRGQNIVNEDGTLNWNKRVKIDGERRTLGEWQDELKRLSAANAALTDSVASLQGTIVESNATIREMSGDGAKGASDAASATRNWNSELKETLSTVLELKQTLGDKRASLASALNEFFSGQGYDYLTTFKMEVENLLRTTGIELESLLNGGWENVTSITRQTTEGRISDFISATMNAMESGGEDVFNRVLKEFREGFPELEQFISERIERISTNTSRVNTGNLFNLAGVADMLTAIADLDEKVGAYQTRLNALETMGRSLTKEERTEVDQLKTNIAALQDEYAVRQKQADSMLNIIKLYNEGHQGQLALFRGYRDLINLTKDYTREQDINSTYWKESTGALNDLGRAMATYNRDMANATMDEDTATRQIEYLRQELNAFGTTQERKLEISRQILEQEKIIADARVKMDEAEYDKRTAQLDNYASEVDAATAKMAEDLRREYTGILNMGVFDYNYDFLIAQEEHQAALDKLANLNRMWRQGQIADEAEYQARRVELAREAAEKEIALEEAAATRKQSIHEAYYSAYEALGSKVSSLMGEIQSGYDSESEEYRRLAEGMAWIDTASGTLAAFMSGVKSGIPAPANLVLATALAGLTLSQGLIGINNIRNGKATQLTASATGQGTSTYETLAYTQNAQLLSAVRDAKVWVTEGDIRRAMDHVSVTQGEAIF